MLTELTSYNLNDYMAQTPLPRPQYIAQANGLLSPHLSMSNKIVLAASQSKSKKKLQISQFFILSVITRPAKTAAISLHNSILGVPQ